MYTALYISQWYHAAYSHAIFIFEWGDLEHPVVQILCTQRGVPLYVCKVIGKDDWNVNFRLEETGVKTFRNAENDLDACHTIAFK